MNGITKTSKAQHHSLSPEKAAERNQLREAGQQGQLEPTEAERLRQLLLEDANDDFARGAIGILAFIAITIGITAIIASLSKKS